MAGITEVMALAVVGGVTILLARYLTSYLHFRKLELGIPGPPSLFLLGNALDFAVVTQDNVMQTMLRMVGGRREMCRFSLFNQLLVCNQDPEEIEELVRSKKFNDKSNFVYGLLHVMAKKGLLQLGGAEWKAHRKWLEPGFHINVLYSFVDVFNEEAKGFVDRVVVDKEVDVQENVRKASLRMAGRTTFLAGPSEYEEEATKCCLFLELFLRTVNNRSFNPILWSDRVFNLTSLGKSVHKSKKEIDELVNRFITQKRAEMGNNKNECDFERAPKTLIDIMLDPATGSQELMEGDAILDEVKTFFGTNVETTVSALTWLLKVLSLLPEVQEKIHAELFSVFGDSDRDVSIEDLPKLKYLTRVIKEVQRLFPTVPFVARQCYEETTLCGRTIPAGTAIIINIFGAHRDPKHWDKPEVFDPDRFLPERSKGRHPCAFMPFSAGPRKCIGGKYAMMSMEIFLAVTLRAFTLLPVGDHKDLKSLADNMTFDVSSHLVGGARVKFHRRRAKAP